MFLFRFSVPKLDDISKHIYENLLLQFVFLYGIKTRLTYRIFTYHKLFISSSSREGGG